MNSPLAEALLGWYAEHKRELPWRQTSDAYRIWAAEIMLQQTRAAVVSERYEAFIQRFPTVKDLAAAAESEVLALWQGLGYYNRARRLWQAAKLVETEYGGVVPSDPQLLRQLPGIGEYTAAAIASIAWNQPLLAVDGNLLRVGARLFCVTADIRRQQAKRLITEHLSAQLPSDRPGEFNQALMDLGSAVCIPKQPRCHDCPLVSLCQAYHRGLACQLPVRTAAKAPRKITVDVLHWTDPQGWILLRQREDQAFLGGLWELPWVEYSDDDAPDRAAEASALFTAEATVYLDYVFSHKHWLIRAAAAERSRTEPLPAAFQVGKTAWFAPSELPTLPMATVFRRIGRALACSYIVGPGGTAGSDPETRGKSVLCWCKGG